MAGSKRAGVGQTILGAVLVVVGYVLSAYGYRAAGAPIAKMGWAMVAGGVVQMLSPQRRMSPAEAARNEPSYGMDGGALNEVDAGTPVPLAYGRIVAGSVQASAGLSTDELILYSAASLPKLQLPNYMNEQVVDPGYARDWGG